MTDFLGLRINDFGKLSFSDKKSKPAVINFINAWSYYCFYHNQQYRKAIQNSINFPDGMSIVWVGKLIQKSNFKRFSGYNLLLYILENSAQFDIKKVLFVGSSSVVQTKIKERITIDYPNIEAVFIPFPFKFSLGKADSGELFKKMNVIKPDVVFVGLSAPKQEIFSDKYLKKNKNIRFICNIGAAFEFFAGTEPRAPLWMQKSGLEGVYRTFFHPIRHIKKDIRSYPFLLIKLIKHFIYE